MVVFVSERALVSARRTPLRSTSALRDGGQARRPLGSPIELRRPPLRAQADVLVQIVRDVTGRVDDVEDRAAWPTGPTPWPRQASARCAGCWCRAAAAAGAGGRPRCSGCCAASARSGSTRPGVLALRQSTEEPFGACRRDMSGARQERIKLLQEEIVCRASASRRTAALFTLTIVTVLALPMTIVSELLRG